VRLSLRRAMKFWTVGLTGAIIQSVVFYALTRYAGMADFISLGGGITIPWALGWSIVLAAISNYIFNELWTWRDAVEPGRSPTSDGN
jgi:putative flippase GtrA